MEWNEWIQLEWNGSDLNDLNGMEWNGMEWTETKLITFSKIINLASYTFNCLQQVWAKIILVSAKLCNW